MKRFAMIVLAAVTIVGGIGVASDGDQHLFRAAAEQQRVGGFERELYRIPGRGARGHSSEQEQRGNSHGH